MERGDEVEQERWRGQMRRNRKMKRGEVEQEDGEDGLGGTGKMERVG